MNSEQDWCELETLPHPDQAADNFTDASVTWGEFISFHVKKNFCDFSVCSEVVRFVFAWEKAKGAKKKFFAFFLRRSSDVCVFPHLLSWKWISLFLQLLSCDKRWAQTLMCFPGQSKTTSAGFFFTRTICCVLNYFQKRSRQEIAESRIWVCTIQPTCTAKSHFGDEATSLLFTHNGMRLR